MYRTPLLILAAAAIVACGGEPPETTAPAPVAADITAKALTGNSPGKPSVPLSLGYEFLQTPAIGQPLTVRLRVAPGNGIALGDMSVTTRGALTLSNNTPAQVALKAAAAAGDDGSMRRDIVVTPADTGRSYLNVQISGTSPDGPFTKAIAIPVQVGTGGPKLESNGEIIDDGVEVLSSMPADQQLDDESPR